MSWLDLIVLIVIAVSAFLGLKTGIIKATLSLAGVIVGVVLAGRYYGLLSEQLTFISQEGVAKVAAFAIILIGIIIIASVTATLLKWATSLVMLGWVNHLGGAVFGFVMGTLFCSALLAIWVKYLGTAGIINQSAFAVTLLDRFPAVLALLPDEFSTIRSFFR